MSFEVPFVRLGLAGDSMKRDVLAVIERVLDSGQFILGAEVERFEAAFAARCGARFAIGMDNGTSALIQALRVLGIGAGDEVITAPNSFVGSAAAIALVGARPVFVDVGDDLSLDPALIEAAVTSRTRAIMPVHLTGRPAAMDRIVPIEARHGLHVVEDAAQSIEEAPSRGKKYSRLRVRTSLSGRSPSTAPRRRSRRCTLTPRVRWPPDCTPFRAFTRRRAAGGEATEAGNGGNRSFRGTPHARPDALDRAGARVARAARRRRERALSRRVRGVQT